MKKEGFISFKTNVYKLNYYETPTGFKFIMNTDLNVGNIRDILHQLYSSIFVTYIVKNPLCSTIETINNDNDIFIEKLDEFISTLPFYVQTINNNTVRSK
ncbi:unnamed protein product [Didymodactylos carnosus]|uniref:Trafficking protein particle complex subunit n=1 Tax=Didymodactylos carnosus TaxID=1234261 RepID=A0A815HF03_9BILA|nr:unnamed protein product [Didymodactylos carnosus]CAF1351520.1 unnamed protein product [Didymodactylos carnosus]CAF3716651.1 unnamed protein product [Didymodactylos carnosus]CAF4221885.1 unnamed protein product [Didymodactylos carnosus]